MACVERAELGERRVVHRARAVGGAIDGVVVHAHDLAVGARVHIELEHVCSERGCVLERRQRLLRSQATAAAVRDEETIAASELVSGASSEVGVQAVIDATMKTTRRLEVAALDFRAASRENPQIERLSVERA